MYIIPRLGHVALVSSLGLFFPLQGLAQTPDEAPEVPAEAPADVAIEADVNLFDGVMQAGGLTADVAAERASYTRLSSISQPDFGGALLTPEQAAAAQPTIDGLTDPGAQALWTNLFDGLSSSEGFSFPVLLNQYALRASLTYPVSDLFFSILPGYRAQ